MKENVKKILIVEDEKSLRELLEHRLSRKGNIVDCFASAEKALQALPSKEYDIALIDIKLPGMNGLELLQKLKSESNIEVIIITGHGSIESAISAMKMGAYDYLTKPCKLAELEILIDKAYEKKVLKESNIKLKEELQLKTCYGKIVGKSKEIKTIIKLIEKVAPSTSTVLIEGETGTGKELVAHEIHRRSARQEKPFIVVHCTTLPEHLLESELFGHEKGSFTGAFRQKRGLVEVAHGGTLFIDEVGEISPAIQAKLLRFIETNRFRRVGLERELEVDVRIIAATNKDLLNEVRKGHFREDLYYRLNVIKIHLPPLRERKEDIPLLANYFLKVKNGFRVQKRLSKKALDVMISYDWPGNVRELINVIERAIILSGGKEIIDVDDLAIRTFRPNGKIKTLKELEKEHIANVLRSTGGNKSKAAKLLGISLRNLYRKIKRYGLA